MQKDALQIITEAIHSWQPPEVPEDIPQGDMPGDKVWIGPLSIEKGNVTFRAMLPMLKEALEAMQRDAPVMDVLGSHVAEHYIRGKLKEWNEYQSRVSNWELEKYLVIY